jgi:23S rRNA pseudoU1915 N3-methylase RlmH
LIDNYENKNAIFFDKNDKHYTYNIHLVNKCSNKRFMKRYEHYKKVFYEKMEERYAKIVKQKENQNNNSEIKKEPNKVNTDLNKTT